MKLSDEFLFMNYLLEKYATYKGMTAGEVLKEWTAMISHKKFTTVIGNIIRNESKMHL